MTHNFNEEDTIKLCIELLSQLISPLNVKKEEKTGLKNVDDVLEHNLLNVRASFKFKNLKIEEFEEFSWRINDSWSKSRWQFVCSCLQLLKMLKNVIDKTNNDKVRLLSISQKKIIENGLQFVISLGLLPYLLPGVGVSLEAKCKHVKNLNPESLKDFAKYRRLCFVMTNLLDLNTTDVLHEILVSKYLEDILAGLFQLSFAPLKKPLSTDSLETFDLKNLDDDFEVTEMTAHLWNKLEADKVKYRRHLHELQKQTYQPLIIRKYLVLLNINKTPRWIKQNITKLLNDIILQDGGIIALIRAVVEVDSESPQQWSHCDVVAKLISNTALSIDHNYLKLLIPQILKILRYGCKHKYEFIYIQVISLAVKFMWSENPNLTKEFILHEIFKPLKDCQFSSEEHISEAIEELYNLCCIPSNTSAAVEIDIIKPVLSVLFHIYCKVKDSVSHLKSPLKKLLEKFVQEAKIENLVSAFDYLIFDEVTEDIVDIPKDLKFMFSTNGGVCVVKEENNIGLEIPVLFLNLIKNMEINERSVNSLFIHLLQKFVKLNEKDENDGEKRLIAVILLTELSQNEYTLKQIIKNSENIIHFINDLLCIQSKENNEIICICLTFLTMVIYDLKKKKEVNWKPFDDLLKPLKKLKNNSISEIKLLADEVDRLIRTRAVVQSELESSPKLIEEVEISACEKAFEDACDSLLPVRAHGLMELISLLQNADAEILAKIDKILCLFQENMKDKDSFLYLRAIEGLSTVALMKPEKILPILCQEFITCDNSETRLKIGEILMRTVRLLKDFVPTYKQLLVNTFLNGVKSDDYLLRASSLSNLGEVCLILKYKIEDVIFEILYCTRNVALSDSNPEARRAAVFLISSILKGLETYMFKILEFVLLDLYKTLQQIGSSDSDEVTRIHAHKSLEVLNENVKQFFNVVPNFEKRIRILDS